MLPDSVAVIANKGGTGKSLVAVNVAFTLRDRGHKVGLLDCDLDSPNIPSMLGIPADKKVVLDEHRIMIPVEWEGLRVFSSALWMGRSKALSKLGEEHRNFLRDAICYTDWSGVDIMVLDMPAGSGDEFLTMKETFKGRIIGAIVVTQPSTIEDVGRVYELCSRFGIRIIGLIENMSHIECECGAIHYPFGGLQAESYAKAHNIQFLGNIPLSSEVNHRVSTGNPSLSGICDGVLSRAVDKVEKWTSKPSRTN